MSVEGKQIGPLCKINCRFFYAEESGGSNMHTWVSEFCTWIGGVHKLKTLDSNFPFKDGFEGLKWWERIRSFPKVFKVKVF